MSVKKSNSNSKTSSRFISSDKPVNKILLAKVKSIISIMTMILNFIFVQLPVYSYTIFLRTFIYLALSILRFILNKKINYIYININKKRDINKDGSNSSIKMFYININKKRYINKDGDSLIKIEDNQIKISVEKSKELFIQVTNILNKALNLLNKAEHYIFYAIQLAIIISLMTYIPGINMNNLDFVKNYLLQIYEKNSITAFVINNSDINTLLNSSLSELISIFKEAKNN